MSAGRLAVIGRASISAADQGACESVPFACLPTILQDAALYSRQFGIFRVVGSAPHSASISGLAAPVTSSNVDSLTQRDVADGT